MGSSFSVKNDTDEPVWISDGVCKEAIFGTIGAIAGVVTLGAGALALAAGAGAGAAAAGGVVAAEAAMAGGAMIGTMEGIVYTSAVAAGLAWAADGAVVLGLSATAWGVIGTVSAITGMGAAGIKELMDLTDEEKEKVLKYKEKLEKQLKGYTRLNPGEESKITGTLNLVWSVYIIKNTGAQKKRNCWTGATAGSIRTYTISKDFTDGKK